MKQLTSGLLPSSTGAFNPCKPIQDESFCVCLHMFVFVCMHVHKRDGESRERERDRQKHTHTQRKRQSEREREREKIQFQAFKTQVVSPETSHVCLLILKLPNKLTHQSQTNTAFQSQIRVKLIMKQSKKSYLDHCDNQNK